ncbi:MAG: putative carbonic anhydrase/acetyltransferase [Clostridia bacterium]|jgi:carbonic anhydrase/acetyltransferase-like protein (isoleucine patch superfamily)|nr:putative carbonic anhydrase/acetyltransferase [Clostridia bacterium]
MIIQYKNHSPKIAHNAFVAPNSTIIGRCTVEENSSIWFNVVIRADVNEINIGKNVNIQDGSVVHCDHDSAVTVSDNVTIGHNAIIHGCSIGSNCIIGMGSTILDGVVIEGNCIIGANSLVTSGKQIPEGSLVMGSPAKVIRQLSETEIEGIKNSVAGYVSLSKEYK